MIESSKSIWSYSLYGDNYESYFKPLIENIEISEANNAVVVLNVLDIDLERVISYFDQFLGRIHIFSYDSGKYGNNPKILRFLVSNQIESKFYFYKDSDSVVNAKEIHLMNDWLESEGPSCMIVRDHHLHVFPILAGMFGANKQIANLIAESAYINFFAKKPRFTNSYCYDQDWLRCEIYPKIVSIALVYSNYFYFSGERLKETAKNNSLTKFIGAQQNLSNVQVMRNHRYLWMYQNGMLHLPYYRRLEFIYRKVRINLVLAYLYTKATHFFMQS